MTHIASVADAPSGTSGSLQVPSGAQVGDLAILQYAGATSAAVTLPAGFVERVSGDIGNMRYWVGTRLLTSADLSSTLTATWDVSQKVFLSLTVVRGVAATPESTPEPIAANVAATTRTIPTATLADTRQVLAGVMGRGNDSPTSWTPPSGLALEASAFGAGGGACSGAIAYTESSGSVGGGDWTQDIADLRAVTWLLVLAPEGSEPTANLYIWTGSSATEVGVLGVWDGSAVQEAEVLGEWDGTAVQPVE